MTDAEKAEKYDRIKRKEREMTIRYTLRLKKFMEAVKAGKLADVTDKEVMEVYQKKYGK